MGFGAMGAVYKAFDPLIKRTLAIKTIRLDIPRQSPQYKSFIDRFYHEARISGTLSHPNIVTLFDIGEENGLPYLAMEFVEGETIASLLERGVRFKPEKVIGLVPGGVRHRLRAQQGRDPSRHQAVEPDPLRRRAGQGADFGIAADRRRDDAVGDAAGHAVVHVARAGATPRRTQRHLLAGRVRVRDARRRSSPATT